MLNPAQAPVAARSVGRSMSAAMARGARYINQSASNQIIYGQHGMNILEKLENQDRIMIVIAENTVGVRKHDTYAISKII